MNNYILHLVMIPIYQLHAILSIEYISIAQRPSTYYFLFFFSPFVFLLILGFNQSLSIQLSSIFRQLFRVFAHIYYSHRSHIAEKHQAKIVDSTTNTTKNSTESNTSLLDKSFKHFLHLSQGNPSQSINQSILSYLSFILFERVSRSSCFII